ncbi:MAG: lycopene cyclase domain-containing protein [Gemmatimonadota bacterium]
MPVYLIFLAVCFALPAALIGWLGRGLLRRYQRPLIWCFLFVFTGGALWDWIAVRTGVWRYDSAPTLGVWIDGLPIEEFLGFYILGTLLIGVVSLVVGRRSVQKDHRARMR